MPAGGHNEGKASARSDLNAAALIRSGIHPDDTRLNGSGTVICVIDYGFDVLHPALRRPDGATRFAGLINMNCPAPDRLMQTPQINSMIARCEATGSRTSLDDVYDAHADYFGRHGVEVGAHGTWVTSIAAGSRTAQFTGVATGAVLVGVQLALPDHAWREVDDYGQPTWLDPARCRKEDEWGRSGWRGYDEAQAIVDALLAAEAFARSLRPVGIVYNVSIGAWAGSHHANSLVARALRRLSEETKTQDGPMAAVVVGSGNAGVECGHFSGVLEAVDPIRFKWVFDRDVLTARCEAGDVAQSKLEIWSDASASLRVELGLPGMNAPVVCALERGNGGTQAIEFRQSTGADWGAGLIGVAQHCGHVRDGLQCVRVILAPALSAALMRQGGSLLSFDVYVSTVMPSEKTSVADFVAGGRVHAWLERDCDGPCAKLVPSDDVCGLKQEASSLSTLTSLACADGIVAVAGLDNTASEDVSIGMSGQGPQPWFGDPEAWRNDVQMRAAAPHLAAPACGIWGARSKTQSYMRGAGTSAAAAFASGATALVMQQAACRGERLSRRDLVEALTGAATSSWQPDIGYGALCFSNTAGRYAGVDDTNISSFPEVLRQEEAR